LPAAVDDGDDSPFITVGAPYRIRLSSATRARRACGRVWQFPPPVSRRPIGGHQNWFSRERPRTDMAANRGKYAHLWSTVCAAASHDSRAEPPLSRFTQGLQPPPDSL